MLIEFSVSNFRSFKEEQTLSMVATRMKELEESNVFKVDDDLSLVRSVAIYGANASGKSNLIAAMRFMRDFVLRSSRDTQINERIKVEPFRLSTETELQPSSFEIVFLIKQIKYRYGFAITAKRVIEEWLYYVPTTRETRLFERDSDEIALNNTAFREGRGLTKRTRANALFLSVVAQFNGEIAIEILRWFSELDLSVGLNDVNTMLHTLNRFEDRGYTDDIVRFVTQLDLGISTLHLEKYDLDKESFLDGIPAELRGFFEEIAVNGQETKIRTGHPKYDNNGQLVGTELFDLSEHESEGTKKLFALAYPLIHVLQFGGIIIIDELDARLHPLITCEIIKLFHSTQKNVGNAQLIFTTHDTNLLDNRMFRRDQIWFTEKTRHGDTHLYSLVEYKVRNDTSLEKNYIEGRYGAIPFLGDFSNLLQEQRSE